MGGGGTMDPGAATGLRKNGVLGPDLGEAEGGAAKLVGIGFVRIRDLCV